MLKINFDHKFVINKFLPISKKKKKKKESSTSQAFYAIEIVRNIKIRDLSNLGEIETRRFFAFPDAWRSRWNGWKITDRNASGSVIYRAVHRHDSFRPLDFHAVFVIASKFSRASIIRILGATKRQIRYSKIAKNEFYFADAHVFSTKWLTMATVDYVFM